jgi:hypothetical protein
MSLRRDILRHYATWRPILGLEGWNIVTRFDERQLKGYCIASPKYLEATIGFNLPRIRAALRKARYETHWYEPLEELVLHEMVHIVNPRASETSVSQMTLSLLRARALAP